MRMLCREGRVFFLQVAEYLGQVVTLHQGGMLDKSEREGTVSSAIDAMRLHGVAHRPISSLSEGEKWCLRS